MGRAATVTAIRTSPPRRCELAFLTQSRLVVAHYLEEIHALGAALSLSTEHVRVTPELAGAGRRLRRRFSAARATSPIGARSPGVYARLAAAAPALTGAPAARPSPIAGRPYVSADELKADLEVIQASLVAHHGELFRHGRLADLIRAVDCFGFHLATLDLRQNSDVHERVVAELLKTVGACTDYLALAEAERVRLLEAELSTLRPLTSPLARYSDETLSELAVLRAAAAASALYGPKAIDTYVISKTTGGLRPAGGLCAAEGGRALRARRSGPLADPGRAAVRDHRRPRGGARHHARASWPRRPSAPTSRRAACRRS